MEHETERFSMYVVYRLRHAKTRNIVSRNVLGLNSVWIEIHVSPSVVVASVLKTKSQSKIHLKSHCFDDVLFTVSGYLEAAHFERKI